MSLDNCLNSLRAAGKIDPGREDQARKIYEEIRAAIGDEAGGDEAAARATANTLDRLKREAAEKRRQTLLQATRQREIMGNLRDYRTSSGREDWSAAATAHFDRDEAATFSNVEARRKSILGQAHGKMVDVLATFRRDLLGRVRQDAKLDNVVRAAFGEAIEDPSARELAHAWTESAEYLRNRFNAAGGHVPKRKDWGLPQTHDMVAVRRAGFDDWRAFVRERLDPSRMYDELTGRPMTPQQVERTLRSVYDTISTSGWNTVELNGVAMGGKFANRRADPRYLAFKNADAWLEYHGKFSKGTPFDVMLGHIDGMARDTAMVETLGPNPGATLRWLEQLIQKRAAEGDAVAGRNVDSNRTRVAVKQMRDMFAHLSGRTASPVSERLAHNMAGVRALLVSAQLGSAALSATSDLAFQRIAAKHAGLPVAGVMGGYLKLLRPTVTEDQKIAVRLGLIAENWSTIALAQQRYTDQVSGPEIARRLSDFTMRASLLSPWTQAGRWAFGMEFLGTLADHRAMKLSELPAPLSRTLQRYGIKDEEWNLIRSTPLFRHKGATFLRPDDIAARRDLADGLSANLASKVLEMVQTETEFAIPSGSVRGRAVLMSDVPAGTFLGEVIRSVAMYKNFGVTLMFTHARRAVMAKGAMSKAAYGANLIVSATVMGALAMQLKSVSKGKEPVDMTGDKAGAFWGAAMLQGGGLGIYGDFLFSDVNRFGGGLADTLAGPVVSAANDVRKATIGNALKAVQGEDTHVGRDAIGLAERYTPGGALWYGRLAYQRLLLDQIRKEADPDYQEHFRAMESRARADMGQDFWWKPGEATPELAQ